MKAYRYLENVSYYPDEGGEECVTISEAHIALDMHELELLILYADYKSSFVNERIEELKKKLKFIKVK